MRTLGVLIALLAAAALGACGGGGNDSRDDVNAYIEGANTVEHRYAADFKRANDAYLAYSRGELAGDRAQADLTRAQTSIRAARDDLARLRPPARARSLHDRLVRYLGKNLAFARETARLAAYQPDAQRALRPLAAANRRLSSGLGGARDPARQAQALQRFARTLQRMLVELRALDVPAVLRPTHGDQLRRLDRTRSLAVRLRHALIDQDAQRVARLVKAFRANAAARAPRRTLQSRAIRRYEARYKALNDAYAAVLREQSRLDQSLR
jgi:hypothetical protein